MRTPVHSKASVIGSPVIALTILLAIPAHAVMPGEELANPALEARARALSLELRCLVCQNQSIDDSNAPLARDLRLIVRERLLAGDSDKEVLNFLEARYGSFVRLRPPFRGRTLLLWLGPAIALVLALLVFGLHVRRGRSVTEREVRPLTDDERLALARLTGDHR